MAGLESEVGGEGANRPPGQLRREVLKEPGRGGGAPSLPPLMPSNVSAYGRRWRKKEL